VLLYYIYYHKGLDGRRIIIFGGFISSQFILPQPRDSLYVLDIINFEWYIPKTSGNEPSSRGGHKANVIGKYMVISFGTYNIYVFSFVITT